MLKHVWPGRRVDKKLSVPEPGRRSSACCLGITVATGPKFGSGLGADHSVPQKWYRSTRVDMDSTGLGLGLRNKDSSPVRPTAGGCLSFHCFMIPPETRREQVQRLVCRMLFPFPLT